MHRRVHWLRRIAVRAKGHGRRDRPPRLRSSRVAAGPGDGVDCQGLNLTERGDAGDHRQLFSSEPNRLCDCIEFLARRLRRLIRDDAVVVSAPTILLHIAPQSAPDTRRNALGDREQICPNGFGQVSQRGEVVPGQDQDVARVYRVEIHNRHDPIIPHTRGDRRPGAIESGLISPKPTRPQPHSHARVCVLPAARQTELPSWSMPAIDRRPQDPGMRIDSHIRTPDQRLRVFVSSTLQELAPERAAARRAISSLRLSPVLFELGARPHPPRALYRAYLSQSDMFVGIYWQSYGWVAPSEAISGLEDEYDLADQRPKLIYVKAPAPEREARMAALLDRIRADDRASYKRFESPEELEGLLAEDLALLLTERFVAGGRRLAAHVEPRRACRGAHPSTSAGDLTGGPRTRARTTATVVARSRRATRHAVGSGWCRQDSARVGGSQRDARAVR